MGNKENGVWTQPIEETKKIVNTATYSTTRPFAVLWERTKETRARLMDDLFYSRVRKLRFSRTRMRRPRFA